MADAATNSDKPSAPWLHMVQLASLYTKFHEMAVPFHRVNTEQQFFKTTIP